MDTIMEVLAGWADRLEDSGRNRLMLAILAGAGVLLLAVAYLIAPHSASGMAFVAGLAGVSWTVCAFLVWYQLLPLTWSQKLWFRSYMPLIQRRKLVGAVAFVWVILIAIVGKGILEPFVGALNVVMATGLWRTFTSTAEEREALNASFEEDEDTWDDDYDYDYDAEGIEYSESDLGVDAGSNESDTSLSDK